ncbi:MAG: antitoxin [Candidatus Aminicenantes bacterium]|nr:antitoxin [Candidatus Aminicenantes bacterium]NIM78587.1 antitoxin [Candidatus Aminicenantes bacterium]NIN17834.1 antitoxin [Candidatus Aminicenantes bacterium]NIN41738.1 antitoxin [Candidatus Aminicenantes bacterium]NIN84487.1 antitoxin [Candidatus Aminicenantes bacterium]
MSDKNKKYLDEEERDIIESVERGEWQSAPDVQERLKAAREIASNTISKSRRVNIDMSETDFLKIKAKARIVGMPYQTLIGAILHQYAEGEIKGVI